jgi:hypothetical protein
MASAYLFAMLAVTPSKSREVALVANPQFEASRVAGHRARRLLDGGNTAFTRDGSRVSRFAFYPAAPGAFRLRR